MASRSTVVVDLPGVVIVRVDHGIADSFSRSVIPATARAWKRATHYGLTTRCRVVELAPDFTVEGTRCASFAAFGATHPAATGALTGYIEGLQSVED